MDRETPKAASKPVTLPSATKTPSAFKRKAADEVEEEDTEGAPPVKRLAFATSTPHNTSRKSDSGFDDESANSGNKKKLPVTPFRRCVLRANF